MFFNVDVKERQNRKKYINVVHGKLPPGRLPPNPNPNPNSNTGVNLLGCNLPGGNFSGGNVHFSHICWLNLFG